MKESELKQLIKEELKKFYIMDIDSSYLLESEYAELNELKIDEFNSYEYNETQCGDIPGLYKAWSFKDRCNNELIALYLNSIGEFKSGYRVEGIKSLIFDPKKLTNGEELIKPCPDNKRVNTIYKILINEIIPFYLLNKSPNRLLFNPVSDSRNRLVDMIINKILIKYPQLKKNNNYLINI